MCPSFCGDEEPAAPITSPYRKTVSIFEAEIFIIQLNWQNKHITKNVAERKYGICILALNLGGCGKLIRVAHTAPG